MTAITDLLAKCKQQQQHRLDSSTAGFTLVEVLVVVIMVGVLATIGGAGYVSWLNKLRVNAAQEVVLTGIQTAQLTAKRQNATWQFSIRQKGDRVEWAVHPANANLDTMAWQTIEQLGVKVDTASTRPSGNGTSTNPWQVEFDYRGFLQNSPQEKPPRITLSSSSGIERCVIVKTLLGALRTDRDGENCSS